MAFGYIGKEPTNDITDNNGVFSLDDLNELEEDAKLNSKSFQADFLVVAGGGGGGVGASGNFGGGGGAGGVISSVDNQGGGNTLDSAKTLAKGVAYSVEVGAGSNANGYLGGHSNFDTLTAVGGGRGWRSNRAIGGGSAGGGGRAFNWLAYARSVPRAMSDSAATLAFGSVSNQGSDGNNTGYESYNSAGGGGGASGNRGTRVEGSNGIIVNIASTTNAGAANVGEVSGSNVYYGGGGAGGHYSFTNGGLGGGGNGKDYVSNTGDANTGGGGGGNLGTGSAGGSGVVIIRYPDTLTCTASAGVVGVEKTEANNKKTFIVTSGSGTLTWSDA
tara:strand:+ start:5109 stop:6101 length:993 start_codon:yes stop_codon:yes gene_type:complete